MQRYNQKAKAPKISGFFLLLPKNFVPLHALLRKSTRKDKHETNGNFAFALPRPTGHHIGGNQIYHR
jgi:hypothetical protein